MIGAGKYTQFLQHVPAELILGKHASNSFLNQNFRTMLQSLNGSTNTATTRGVTASCA